MIEIVKPTLLIDEQKCKENIRRMADKARINNLKFRPHFKTHQSHAIGEWFKDEGVEAITVSSLGMANYFSAAGWKEMTVAFPCNIREIDLINQLAQKITLNLLVDNVETVDFLTNRLQHPVNLYIEIDTGKGRTGINADNTDQILKLLNWIAEGSNISAKGLYLHAGHSYDCRGSEGIRAIYNQASIALGKLKQATKDFPSLEFCYGDTPTCSIIDKFENIDAISPGNFVFYDIMQEQIGACSIDDIAVIMACPVVSIHTEKNQVCIYGGAVHLSKDAIIVEGQKVYGKVVIPTENVWSEVLEDCSVMGLSQEHGLISMSDAAIKKLKIGDILGVIPVHSCLTAECLGRYLTTKGVELDHYSKKKHTI